jgi:hypothetical protein
VQNSPNNPKSCLKYRKRHASQHENCQLLGNVASAILAEMDSRFAYILDPGNRDFQPLFAVATALRCIPAFGGIYQNSQKRY